MGTGVFDICSMVSTCPSLIVVIPPKKTHRGPYTTARTVARTRVFELEAHIERLASTAALMWPDEQGALLSGWMLGKWMWGLQSPRSTTDSNDVDSGLPAAMTDPATLKPLLLQTLRSAIHHYRCVAHPERLGRCPCFGSSTPPSLSEQNRETHPSSAEEEIELKLTILMVWHRRVFGRSNPK